MKIAVMAAGGLGGYCGALLARLGHDVTFIARGEHLKALRASGLTIRSPHGDFELHPVRATADPASAGTADWVLFAVKTYDTVNAAQVIRPLVGKGTAIITLQNGVEAPFQIGALLGIHRVLAAPIQIVSNLAGPGVIEQRSQFRRLTIGEARGGLTPRLEKIAAELRGSGLEVSVTGDVRRALWHKFVFIASIAGLATMERAAPHDLLQRPDSRARLRSAMEEVFAVGDAHGVNMDADIVERQYKFSLEIAPGQKPSMLLDLEQGKRLEIDALSGAVVRLGAEKRIRTPVHLDFYTALRARG